MRSGAMGLIIALAITLGALIAGGAYLVAQISTRQTVTSTPAVAISPTESPVTSETNTVVVYEAEGSIPPADKIMLQQRVVNPLVDYYKEANQGDLVSLTISANLQASKTSYPYLGSAVLSGGGNLGFLISQSDGEISWWFPECMGQCPLSQTYQDKYPEVAKLLGY